MGAEFESRDIEGSTVHRNGTASTSVTTLTFTTFISEFIIVAGTPNRLQISFDNSNWFPISSVLSWTPKRTNTVYLRTSSSTTTYSAIFNVELY